MESIRAEADDPFIRKLVAESGILDAPWVEQYEAADGLRLYTVPELLAMREPAWLVDPFIPEEALVVLFGPSGTFKSFIAIDWAAWAPGLAVYVSAEGSPRRFGERVAAWEQANGRPAGILCHPYAINLLTDGAAALADALGTLTVPVSLLVVDTAARNMAGGDENSAQDMGRLVSGLDRLRAEFGCAAVVLHHTGHDKPDRERGSSALRGACDVSVRTEATGRPREVRLVCAKVRDSDEFAPRVARLEPVGGSLVVAEAVTVSDTMNRAVGAYLAEHPEASQREVEREVPGNAAQIRAAYKRQTASMRPSASTPMDAPPGSPRPASPRPPLGGRGAAAPSDAVFDLTDPTRDVDALLGDVDRVRELRSRAERSGLGGDTQPARQGDGRRGRPGAPAGGVPRVHPPAHHHRAPLDVWRQRDPPRPLTVADDRGPSRPVHASVTTHANFASGAHSPRNMGSPGSTTLRRFRGL